MPLAPISPAGLLIAMPLLLGLATPAVAQVTADNTQALDTALTRLAKNPADAGALIEAGDAALAIGDAEAAVGFFTRAEEVAPGNVRAKAGLASAYVRKQDPFTAIRLFSEVEQAGPLYADALIDRGLAYDLVGDNLTAQRYYRMAGPRNDEALRRLALSLAIAGDKRASEAALAPLLARQDKSAWRVRAFSLAILGETAQAVSISNAMLPAGLATAITPYLRYMGQLTRAQQAAAANLGHFPRASEIGRDDPRIALYSRPAAAPTARNVDAGLIPAGEPLGKRPGQRAERETKGSRKRDRDRQAGPERERPPEPVVATSTRPAAAAPAPAAASAPAAALVRAAPAAPRTAEPQVALAETARPAAAPSRPVQGPSFELVPAASSQPTAQPVPTAAPAAAAPAAAAPVGPPAPAKTAPAQSAPAQSAPASLTDAFSEFTRPTISTTPAPGAVDVRKIIAARPKPKEVKPAPPAQPSRIWVQVATGRDKKALAFDWRRMARRNAAMFKGRKAYVTAWNQTNRLLTGPFESEAKASEFMNQLRKEDVAGAFLWTSPAGQVVDELSGTK